MTVGQAGSSRRVTFESVPFTGQTDGKVQWKTDIAQAKLG